VQTKTALGFLCLLLLGATLQASDRYWLSWNHHGTDDCYLMAIDELGNQIVKPHVIFNDFHAHATAVASISSTKLAYWANSAEGSNEIHRGTVDKNSFAVSGVKDVLKDTDNNYLQVTQGAAKFFLALESGQSILKGFPLGSSGDPNGRSFRISPRTDGSNEEGGVSADGRVAFTNNSASPDDRIYLQALQANGLPVNSPVVMKAGDFDSVDVSGVLAGNVRYVVYKDVSADELKIQTIDATTLQKVGPERTLADMDPDHDDQMTAIDPLGRFVIFSDNVQSCDVSGILYQALDATGNASGKPKEIIGCGFIVSTGDTHGQRGFDLLKD